MAKRRRKGARTRVPREELVLAEMIANGQSLGLRLGTGMTGLHTVREGRRLLFQPDGSGHACAIGAYVACRSRHIDYLRRPGVQFDDDTLGNWWESGQYAAFERATGLHPGEVYAGNDRPADCGDYGWETREQAVGVAYRAYHEVSE